MAQKKKNKTSGGRWVLAVFGMLLVAMGIFLASFGFSFKMMMLPERTTENGDTPEAQIERLELENAKLEEDIRRLEEQNEILMGGSSSKTSSTSRVAGTSNSSDDED